jgi:hypothetical protein
LCQLGLPVVLILAIFAAEYKAQARLASTVVFLFTHVSARVWIHAVRIAGLYRFSVPVPFSECR